MATYTQHAGDVIVPGAEPATELLSNVGGFIAGCGWAGLDVILHWSKGESVDPSHVSDIIREAVGKHQTVGGKAGSGQATPDNISWIAMQHGVTLQSQDYNTALQQAGKKPVEIGVANARAFGGNDSTVDGHYVTVVGKTRQGDFITSDPNSSESVHGQFVKYSHAQFDAAQPFWAGVPSGKGSGATSPTSNGGTGADCGTEPDIKNYGGYWDPRYWFDEARWKSCVIVNNEPGGQAINPVGGALGGIGDLVQGVVGGAVTALKRIGVFVFGAILLIVGLWAAFHRTGG